MLKLTLTAIALIFLAMPAHAKLQGAPFQPEVDKRFSLLESNLPGYTLTSGQVIVGNGSNIGTAVAISGDAALANTGALTVQAGTITEAKMAVQGTGLNGARIARATWDTTVASGGGVGAHTLGVTLPAKAIIIQAWTYSLLTPTTSAGGTLALSCGSATILTAADVTGYTTGNITAANETGTAANMRDAVTSCNITATVATGTMTAGKLDIFVEYATHE